MTSPFDNPIRGAGGGGKGGGGSAPPVPSEQPNTIRTRSVAKVADVLSEGVIGGLVNGEQSVKINGTPIAAADGTRNISGVAFIARPGLTEQNPPSGLEDVQRPREINVEVKKGEPVVQEITDADVDAARVTVRMPALQQMDPNTGDVKAYSIHFHIEVSDDGGNTWSLAKNERIVNEKSNSPFELSYRIEMPSNTPPWQVRVQRISNDQDSSRKQNRTFFARLTEIVDHKLEYPDTAYIVAAIDAEAVGNRIPRRSYEIDGIRIEVPSNYDPVNRNYSGTWDGTFKRAVSDNPAWVLWDLINNSRYGLGEFVDRSQVDKFTLYEIAQYCDAVDSSGAFVGVDDGFGGKEPRWTFNGVIRTQKEAFKVLQMVASVFRGMVYWTSGAATATADRPKEPVILVAPANVIGGEFTYEQTGYKAQHSVVIVEWNNPAEGYSPDTQVVEDEDRVRRFGWKPKRVSAFGCTSRGQAYRIGRWILQTEATEIETVTYRASFDHMVADGQAVMPGDVIKIADPMVMGVRQGGRVVSVPALNQVQIDSEITFEAGESAAFSVVMPDGTLAERAVYDPGGKAPFQQTFRTNTLQLGSGLPQVPVTGAMWTLSASNVSSRLFRVVNVREVEKNVVEVTALEYNPDKFDRVEDTFVFEKPPFTTLPSGRLARPSDIAIRTDWTHTGSGTRTALNVGWNPPNDGRAARVEVQHQPPGGTWRTVATTEQNETTIENVSNGTHGIRLRTVDHDGQVSDFQPDNGMQVSVDTPGTQTKEAPPPPTGLELKNQANATVFQNRDAKFDWRRPTFSQPQADQFNGPQGAQTGQGDPYQLDFVVQVEVGGEIKREEVTLSPGWEYTYDKNLDDGGPFREFTVKVFSRRQNGTYSVNPESLTVTNPPPAAPTGLGVNGGPGYVVVNYDAPSEGDYAETLVWLSKTPGFDPAQTEPAARGAQDFFFVDAAENTQYYVRVAHADTYYDDDPSTLNISDELAVETAGIEEFVPTFALDGLRMSTDAQANEVSWEAGTVHVTRNGQTTSYSVSADSASYPGSGTLYIYYKEGDGALSTGTNPQNFAATDTIVLAAYGGGTKLTVGRGDAFTHGANVLAGTITGQQLVTGQAVITDTAQMANAVVTNANIANAAVGRAQIQNAAIGSAQIDELSADLITSGELRTEDVFIAGSGRIELAGFNDPAQQTLYVENLSASGQVVEFVNANGKSMSFGQQLFIADSTGDQSIETLFGSIKSGSHFDADDGYKVNNNIVINDSYEVFATSFRFQFDPNTQIYQSTSRDDMYFRCGNEGRLRLEQSQAGGSHTGVYIKRGNSSGWKELRVGPPDASGFRNLTIYDP
jgi:predicted phage tail protein